ncbi:vitamin K epoxide reductase family protein [Candidatus Woesearchaeota archaeon]|nr:vitamin K epoxide reductase family protein [Candidatus Woesearchaeota archaeon]
MNAAYLIILSTIGFAVSFYIFYTKKHGKKMHCVIGENCDDVVKSKYGKTFGIENTIPGMAYYLLVLAYGIAILYDRNVFKENFIYYFIVSASIGSVLFAAYLTSVQAFVLKKWCEYCIVSSISSLLILIVLLLL